MSGSLLVVSGPSGVGKGSICNKLLESINNLRLSVSATTRLPREGEKEGLNYYFLDEKTFKAKIESGSFLEWAQVFDNYYGTPKEAVSEILAGGDDVLLEIDVQGALKLKESFKDAVFIFIVPPTLNELRNRITGRGTETAESIKKRTDKAIYEIKFYTEYDYMVINDNLDDAVEAVRKIIFTERCRVHRYPDFCGVLCNSNK